MDFLATGLIRAFDVLINTRPCKTCSISLTWEVVLLRKCSDELLHGKVRVTVPEKGRGSGDHSGLKRGLEG